MSRHSFTPTGFLLRWAAALILVLATFNPHGVSYYHWVVGPGGENVPLKVLAGIGMLILYVIYLRATWRSIGAIGLVLSAAFFGAVIWALIDFELLAVDQAKVMTYVFLVLFATVMAVGLSWSHVRRRLSGQADIDDVDE